MKFTKTIKFLLIIIGHIVSSSSFAQGDSDEKAENKDPGFWKSIYDLVYKEKFHGNAFYEHAEQGVYRIIDLKTNWKFQIGDNNEWSSATYDDSTWESIYVPEDWEEQGFNGYDGYAWYRIEFDGTQLNANEAHYLLLGFIDDVDETFVNGKLVGRTGRFPPRYRTAYNSNRKYYLSNDLINFKGNNVIAVKVFDEYKNGGIVNGNPGIYVSKGSEKLLQNLYGTWKFTTHNNTSYRAIDYDDEHWDVLLVPAYWDNQGYRSFNGTAWYRKRFELSFKPKPQENYYLVLGKVDDFDVTYLNGELIGETNDHEPVGQSRSYQSIRLYKIPQGLLSTEKENVIAIKVKDIGIDGGIYSGPIGIIAEADITQMIRSTD